MTHVGVKRLGAGRAQEQGAQNQKSGKAVPQQITKAIAWIEGHQNARDGS